MNIQTTIKKLTTTTAIIGVLFGIGGYATPSYAAAPSAAAQAGVADPAPAATGTIIAKGRGLAIFHGNGTATISGNGVLRIKDFAGDAQIEVTGSGRKYVGEHGWITYYGYRGAATVTGSDVHIELSGAGIELNATGTGRFVVRGVGTVSRTVNGTTTTFGWKGPEWRKLGE